MTTVQRRISGHRCGTMSSTICSARRLVRGKARREKKANRSATLPCSILASSFFKNNPINQIRAPSSRSTPLSRPAPPYGIRGHLTTDAGQRQQRGGHRALAPPQRLAPPRRGGTGQWISSAAPACQLHPPTPTPQLPWRRLERSAGPCWRTWVPPRARRGGGAPRGGSEGTMWRCLHRPSNTD